MDRAQSKVTQSWGCAFLCKWVQQEKEGMGCWVSVMMATNYHSEVRYLWKDFNEGGVLLCSTKREG